MHDPGQNTPVSGGSAMGQPTGARPAPASKPPARRGQRPARGSDPVNRWILAAIGAVIIIWLAAVLSAIVFGLLTPPAVPRTAAERDLMALDTTVKSGKADTKTYSQYISVLIGAGQLSKAQDSLDQALKIAKVDRSFLYARQADLAFAKKDYAGTIKSADIAIDTANKEVKDAVDANKKAQRKPYAGIVIPDSYKDACLDKAEALAATNKYAGAIKAFDLYLAQSPTDADILCQRAQMKIKTGDKTGATKDFKEALKYIPDFQPALDGLKQIGAAQ